MPAEIASDRATGRPERYEWIDRPASLNAVARVPCPALFVKQGGALSIWFR
jgi:hypothetical protein